METQDWRVTADDMRVLSWTGSFGTYVKVLGDIDLCTAPALRDYLDLLAFEPEVRTAGDWQAWRSAAGTTVARGGPGSLMFVPARCPHAFANPTTEPVRMLFLFAPAGHELYLAELGRLVSSGGPVDPAEIAAIRARWDIQQLTPLIPGRQ